MKFFIVLLCILYSSALYSEDFIPPSDYMGEKIVSANLNMELLYTNGTMGEYVYDGDNKTSQLKWNLHPAVYIGSILYISFYDKLTFKAAYWSAINRNTGNLTDTDWSVSGIETRRSHHECDIQKADIIDTSIIIKTSDLYFAGILIHAGYKWQNTVIEADDGYVEYTGDSTRIPLEGKFVNYEQSLSLPYAGLSLYIILPVRFYFTTFFSISPFVSCEVVDTHISTGINYYDAFKNGMYYYTSAAIGYQHDRVNINIHIGYTRIPEFRGDTYSTNKFSGARTKTFRNASATEFQSFEAGFAIGTSFDW